MMSVVAVLQGFFLQLEGGGGGGGRVVGDGGRDVHISKDGLVASRNWDIKFLPSSFQVFKFLLIFLDVLVAIN
jgi:hypothetical protein